VKIGDGVVDKKGKRDRKKDEEGNEVGGCVIVLGNWGNGDEVRWCGETSGKREENKTKKK
jgi:hypothetical protein